MPKEQGQVFRRWAETKLYRKTMQVAVAELRRAARAPDVLTKLEALDVAEQRLRDAQWLGPEHDPSRFEAGLAEIAQSRSQTLEQAIGAVDRLITVAERQFADPGSLLMAAGHVLAFLNYYLPEDARVDALNGRLLSLGGAQPAYRPVRPLSEVYVRPQGGTGCGAAMLLLALGMALVAGLGRLVW